MKLSFYPILSFLLTLATIPEPFFFLFLKSNGSNLVCSFGITLLKFLNPKFTSAEKKLGVL